MQNYPLALSPSQQSLIFNCGGDGFWYESGSATSDARIIIKPESGDEVVLKPGQSIRVVNPSGKWYVRLNDATQTVTGNIIIGSGEFDDHNTTIASGSFNIINPNASAAIVQKQAWATITTFAPVTINTGAAQALVHDATQRQLRIRNTHASANLYLGDATVTTANAGIVIAPGATWIEDDAAGAAWYATSDTASINVAIMGLKA